MSALALPFVVTTIRSLVGDLGTGREQSVRKESPAGTVDGVNKLFELAQYPLISGSLSVWKNDALLATPAGYTVNLEMGEITYVVAPLITDRMASSYRFLWFPDDGYHQFIIAAGGHCGVTAVGGTNIIVAGLVVTGTPEGLMQAVRLYAGCMYNFRRADQSAHKFNASAGGQTQSVDSVTRNFREMAKSMCAQAETARDDYYKGFGAADAPAAATGGFAPIPRYQPRR